MSVEASLIFFGVRFAINDEEVASVEDRTHPIVTQARAVGLQVYWENFGLDEPKYLGFVGRRLALLSIENDSEIMLNEATLTEIMRKVREKLASAAIHEEPQLYMYWLPPK